MKPSQLTQSVTVRAQLLGRVARLYLKSDEIRWRILVITSRFTSHIAIIGVALLAAFLASAHLDNPPAPKPIANNAVAWNAVAGQTSTDQLADGNVRVYSPVLLQSYTSILNQDGGLLARRAVPATINPQENRTIIITYTVQSGDTIETIAARFGLLPTTLVWSNTDVETAPDRLSIGQVLAVLPVDGIWYTVEADDTISDIAQRFKAKTEDIVNYPLNNLSGGANLLAGTKIVVPNGVKPYVAQVVEAPGGSYSGQPIIVAASGSFLWPTYGFISQGYYWYHRAIDIANAIGIPIAAADSGYVSYAGWDQTGYGYVVIIDHGNGFHTLYAHLSQYYVDPGQSVRRGQVIAAMGQSGNATGPHLHFEIRYGGALLNPFIYLP